MGWATKYLGGCIFSYSSYDLGIPRYSHIWEDIEPAHFRVGCQGFDPWPDSETISWNSWMWGFTINAGIGWENHRRMEWWDVMGCIWVNYRDLTLTGIMVNVSGNHPHCGAASFSSFIFPDVWFATLLGIQLEIHNGIHSKDVMGYSSHQQDGCVWKMAYIVYPNSSRLLSLFLLSPVKWKRGGYTLCFRETHCEA